MKDRPSTLSEGGTSETGAHMTMTKFLSRRNSRRGGGYTQRQVRFHIISAGLLAVMVVSTVSAGTEGVWSRIGPRGGGVLIQAMAIDPLTPTTIYACAFPQGVHKSTDGGSNWRKLTRGLEAVRNIREIVVDPTSPKNLYVVHDAVATSTALSASTDGGATWNVIGTGFPSDNEIFDLEADPHVSGRLFAGMYDGVYRSVDGGRTWNAANAGLGRYRATDSLVASPTKADTIYAAILDRVMKSQDAGQTWKPTASGLPRVTRMIASPDGADIIYAMVYDTAAFKIFRTEDGGESWTEAFALPSSLGFVDAVALVAASPRALFIGTETGLYKTTDGGETWESANAGMVCIRVRVIATHPHNTAIMYAGTACGIYRTGDGADHWIPRNEGLNYTHYSVTQVQILETIPKSIVVGTDSCGIFQSTDEGRSWQPINRGLTSPRITALAADPTNPDTRYAGTASGEIFKTMDGGAHWTESSTGLPGESISGLAVDRARPNRLYLGTSGSGLFVSSDSGRSWQKASGIITGRSITALALDPSNPSTLYVSTYDDSATLRLFKSIDRAQTWRESDSGLNGGIVTQLAISPQNPDLAYAGTKYGLYRSTDGGAHWKRLGQIASTRRSRVHGLALDPAAPGVLYVSVSGTYASGRGIYRSADGGDTWKLVHEGLEIVGRFGPLVIDPTETDLIYAATEDGVFVRSFAE